MTKRFRIDKEYDTDGNWEYCYVDNDIGRTFNFADDFCDIDFIEYVNAIISSLTDENEQLKTFLESLREELSLADRDNTTLEKENEQLKSDKEHLMGCLIRFFGYDDEDIDYNLNRESNREYGKQYYSMKEETKKELEE